MKCPLCGYQFNEQESKGGCSTCQIFGVCKMIRCPNCGYETPSEPKIVKRFKKWRDKDETKQSN